MYTWKLTNYGNNFYMEDELSFTQEQLELIHDWQVHRMGEEKLFNKLKKTGMKCGCINDLLSTPFEHPDMIEVSIATDHDKRQAALSAENKEEQV